MTVVNIAIKGSIAPQAIRLEGATTNWEELCDFSWQEWSTSSGLRAGIYRFAPLVDDNTEEEIGEDNYSAFLKLDAVAAVRVEGRWVPAKLGEWLVKTHEDELLVMTADEFESTYTVLEPAL